MNNFLNPSEKATLEDGQEMRRKKAEFRSNHRGCKEMDLVMGQFASRHLPGLTEPLLACYEQLLDEEDATLMDWLMGRSEPDAKYQQLMGLLKQYTPG